MAKFATAINCMDGRVQVPVIDFIKKNYQVDYVDMITLPGPDKLLSEAKDTTKIEEIKRCVEISINKHSSKLLVITGHYDCAGNPVDQKTHLEHIKKAISLIRGWNLEVEIIGVWIGKDWKPDLVEYGI